MLNKKIRIGIDVNEANTTNRVGSNQYAYQIIKSLNKIDKTNDYTLYSGKKIIKDLPKERAGWRYKVIPPSKLWTQWRLPIELHRDKKNLDVFFSPGHYAPRTCPVPSVVSIMDLAFLLFPNFYKKKDAIQLTSWTKYSVKNADHIITISENTKKDIKKHYKIKSKKITIAYPGFESKPDSKKQNSKVLKKYGISKGYILYLGTIQPRKNLVRLVQGFNQLNSPHHLVIAGKKGWLTDDLEKEVLKSNKKKKIHLTGYIDNQDVSSIISQSSCLVLPGLYEGFGIPALEALVQGIIPVVSHTGSLPEVIGESGLLIDPYSSDSISKGITNAIKLDTGKKKTMLSKAKPHIKKFDWQLSAKKILKVLHEVSI
ncbi:glycosyltransferase family 4 protein [Patescibacteria group bacterium]